MKTVTHTPRAAEHDLLPGRLESRKNLWAIICVDQVAERTKATSKHIFVSHMCRDGALFDNESALRILKQGISSKVIGPLSQYLELGKGELVLMLDLDRTTATRRADKDLPLPTHSAESVLRLLELESVANDTFESEEAALGWLRRPHPMLDGESPLESAKTSFGARRVKDILVAIKYGGVV